MAYQGVYDILGGFDLGRAYDDLLADEIKYSWAIEGWDGDENVAKEQRYIRIGENILTALAIPTSLDQWSVDVVTTIEIFGAER